MIQGTQNQLPQKLSHARKKNAENACDPNSFRASATEKPIRESLDRVASSSPQKCSCAPATLLRTTPADALHRMRLAEKWLGNQPGG